MGKGFNRRSIAIAAGLMSLAATASARAQGALVLVPTSGADLAFVAPAADAQPNPAEEAIQKFRRAISQAALLQREQTEASCRAGQREDATREQRFAWAANCQYARR